MTYEDCDGLLLVFPNLAPANRCPDFHAQLTILNAERDDRMDEDELEVSCYGSEVEYKDRLKFILVKMQD